MADRYGGDHDADRIAGAVGRRLGAVVSGAPVWAQRPDTGAYGHMVAIKVSAGQAAEMRAMAATTQTMHLGGTTQDIPDDRFKTGDDEDRARNEASR